MAEEMKEKEKKEEVKGEEPKPEVKKEESKPLCDDKVIEEGKQLAWLSYLGLLFLIPLLAKKDNAFCMHHAKQGMVFCIISFVIGIVGGILSFIIIGIPILLICGPFMIVLSIIGLIQAIQGNWWEAPLGLHGLSKKINL